MQAFWQQGRSPLGGRPCSAGINIIHSHFLRFGVFPLTQIVAGRGVCPVISSVFQIAGWRLVICELQMDVPMASSSSGVEIIMEGSVPMPCDSPVSKKRTRGHDQDIRLQDVLLASGSGQQPDTTRLQFIDSQIDGGASLVLPYFDCPLAEYPIQPVGVATAPEVVSRAPESSRPDTMAIIQFLRANIIGEPSFISADTVVVITDTNPFTDYQHWPFTARLLHQRTHFSP